MRNPCVWTWRAPRSGLAPPQLRENAAWQPELSFHPCYPHLAAQVCFSISQRAALPLRGVSDWL